MTNYRILKLEGKYVAQHKFLLWWCCYRTYGGAIIYFNTQELALDCLKKKMDEEEVKVVWQRYTYIPPQ